MDKVMMGEPLLGGGPEAPRQAVLQQLHMEVRQLRARVAVGRCFDNDAPDGWTWSDGTDGKAGHWKRAYSQEEPQETTPPDGAFHWLGHCRPGMDERGRPCWIWQVLRAFQRHTKGLSAQEWMPAHLVTSEGRGSAPDALDALLAADAAYALRAEQGKARALRAVPGSSPGGSALNELAKRGLVTVEWPDVRVCIAGCWYTARLDEGDMVEDAARFLLDCLDGSCPWPETWPTRPSSLENGDDLARSPGR